jgi:AAA+ ATPase superfamily predicted ATPase
MPYYLQVFSDKTGLFQNIRDFVLDEQGLLFNEPHLLLMEDLREPRNYFSILRAIAHGKTKLNDIAQSAQVGDGRITARYLETLKEMRLVKRTVPATEPNPGKSKRGLYEIADPFLRFWFRFVHPYRGSLQLGLADSVLEHHVRPHLNHYVGYAFEMAARAHVALLGRAGELPFIPERIGGFWSRGTEIDVVAVSDTQGACLVGECKWSDAPVGLSILADLRRKVAVVEAMGRWTRTAFALFSKTGFTPELQDVAEREDVLLVGPSELVSPSFL